MARLTVTISTEAKIVALEGDCLAMLGWEPEELLGQDVSEIVPFKYRERHAAGWDRYQRTKEKRAMGSWLEVEARRRDGNVVPISFCVTERDGLISAIMESSAAEEESE